MLNPRLIKQQGIDKNTIDALEQTHTYMDYLITEIDSLDPIHNYEKVKDIIKLIEDTEFLMQKTMEI